MLHFSRVLSRIALVPLLLLGAGTAARADEAAMPLLAPDEVLAAYRRDQPAPGAPSLIQYFESQGYYFFQKRNASLSGTILGDQVLTPHKIVYLTFCRQDSELLDFRKLTALRLQAALDLPKTSACSAGRVGQGDVAPPRAPIRAETPASPPELDRSLLTVKNFTFSARALMNERPDGKLIVTPLFRAQYRKFREAWSVVELAIRQANDAHFAEIDPALREAAEEKESVTLTQNVQAIEKLDELTQRSDASAEEMIVELAKVYFKPSRALQPGPTQNFFIDANERKMKMDDALFDPANDEHPEKIALSLLQLPTIDRARVFQTLKYRADGPYDPDRRASEGENARRAALLDRFKALFPGIEAAAKASFARDGAAAQMGSPTRAAGDLTDEPRHHCAHLSVHWTTSDPAEPLPISPSGIRLGRAVLDRPAPVRVWIQSDQLNAQDRTPLASYAGELPLTTAQEWFSLQQAATLPDRH